MKVYKFGGASVRSAEGIRNLHGIVKNGGEGLFVVISAMGKTTNALEKVVERFTAGDRSGAIAAFGESEAYHRSICSDLFGNNGICCSFGGGYCPASVENYFAEVKDILSSEDASDKSYEYWYDLIVSYGELLSTSIISSYLNHAGTANRWIDMRRCFITEGRHRDANVDTEASGPLLLAAVKDAGTEVIIGQGFIGCSHSGETTTLGREGSDYSAAVAANLLDAESLTIWKDVDGILNADPKIFPDAVHIPELTYLDAVELAYSGAQIIHPKTIKPLQNKNIPLYVRPFGDISKKGSVIKGEIAGRVDVPILIIKHNQMLLSIRPHDFSFVLEDRFASIFALLERYGIKINLIQSSAVNLSLCVDDSRYLHEVVDELKKQDYRMVYNTDMELLTIRGYTPSLYGEYCNKGEIYLTQKTRRIVRFVRRKTV